MKLIRFATSSLSLLVLCGVCGPKGAHGQLQWQEPKKEVMHLRLVALAWNHPRSSFFASEEVFIGEKQLAKEESRLVKLVYDFLPYQPRLSEYGMDYMTMHELRAVRDPRCDETLAHLATGQQGDWRQPRSQLKYSTDAPALNPQRHRTPLPCYLTNADDYSRPLHEALDDPPKERQ